VPGARLDVLAGDPSPAVHAAQPAPAPDEDDSGVVRLEDPPEERGGMAIALLALTLLWKLVYTPVAFTVAALSRSFLSTLNPVIGISTIGSMGVVYWQALVICTVLGLAGWAAGYALNPIPVAGALIRSFTDAYFSLATACTLGLGVFKKAEALGWD